ncbi:hypothetical protein PFDG_03396 [Plasmodium falciparum Dd2]|uniref:Uncharacterized protein n=1 Tax=Plasmodium falciparum (isolate Dd2) TaxID=57267 RepID=A0A0L7M2W4_PLAF4|nr:hypothetical protein PFDG_03396 [Plasmodium falciparum Dd2]
MRNIFKYKNRLTFFRKGVHLINIYINIYIFLIVECSLKGGIFRLCHIIKKILILHNIWLHI